MLLMGVVDGEGGGGEDSVAGRYVSIYTQQSSELFPSKLTTLDSWFQSVFC